MLQRYRNLAVDESCNFNDVETAEEPSQSNSKLKQSRSCERVKDRKKFITTPRNQKTSMLSGFVEQQQKLFSYQRNRANTSSSPAKRQRVRSANWQEKKLNNVPKFDSRLAVCEDNKLLDNKSCSDDGTSLQSFENEEMINEMEAAKIN